MDEFQRVLIERACAKLVIDYARAADDGDAEAFAAVFAEDGVLVPADGEPQTRAQLAATRAPAERPRTLHVCTNISVEVIDATTARGVTYLSFYRASAGGDPLASGPALGRYLDVFRTTPAGWRIDRREYERLFALPTAAS